MAELTDREYNLLMQAMSANSNAMEGLNTAVNTLRLELVERYLTKREDRDQDEQRFRVYDAQFDDLRDELLRLSSETRKNLEQRIKIIQWSIIGQTTMVLALLGYVLRLKGF